jgi:exopolysaccharide production protein ExoZ
MFALGLCLGLRDMVTGSNPKTRQRMTSKIVTVQYLRGLAALLVLASHALLYPLVSQPLVYGRLGWLGVILFFVISGFIMVTVTESGRFDPIGFMRRRVQRIVPLYWAFTLVAAALALVAPQLFKTTVFDAQQLLLSLAFVPFHNAASHGIHPLYKLGWTLNYEMFFYVSFALLAMVTARRRLLWLTMAYLAMAIIGQVWPPDSAFAQFYTSYMPLAFVAGAWLGLAHIEGRLGRISGPLIGAIGVLAAMGLVEGFSWGGEAVEDITAFAGFLIFALGAVGLLVRFDNEVPRIALMEWIGDASYSIYLAHIFAVAMIAGIWLHFFGRGVPGAALAITALSVVGGTGIGMVLYRKLELPLLNWFRARSVEQRARLAANAVDHGNQPV